jgi:hypothetical protein
MHFTITKPWNNWSGMYDFFIHLEKWSYHGDGHGPPQAAEVKQRDVPRLVKNQVLELLIKTLLRLGRQLSGWIGAVTLSAREPYPCRKWITSCTKTAFANMGICSTPNHTKSPGSREPLVSPFTRSTPKEGVATTVVATAPASQWI